MTEYRRGRADGLREAVEIIRRLEEGVAVKLERPSPIRTRDARRVRRQTYQVAITRLTTALKKREPSAPGFQAAMRRLGL